MRVAFVGKGGAGKSSLAGTFARLLAASGERVLALDSDPMPGLAFSLGVDRVDEGLPDEALEEYDDNGRRRYRLRPGLTGLAVVERYAVRGPDRLYLLQAGKARSERWTSTPQHLGFQRVLDDLPAEGWSVVGDLSGGTRQPFLSWARYAETFLVVVEPTAASLLTGRRLARLAALTTAPRVVAVANKVRSPGDVDMIAERVGLPVLGVVPFDPELAMADRLALAVVDRAPEGPTATAIRSLVDVLRTGMEAA